MNMIVDKIFGTSIDYKINVFNTKVYNSRIESFVYEHELDNLVKEETYFKVLCSLCCLQSEKI